MTDGTSVAILAIAAVLGVLTVALVWVFATTGDRAQDTGPYYRVDDGVDEDDILDLLKRRIEERGEDDDDVLDLLKRRIEERGVDDDVVDLLRKRLGEEINIPTRGEPDDFEMLGVLYAVEGEQADTQKNNVLPLWGRQTYRRSHKWNYYAVLDNGVELPLVIDGDDCEDSVGCDELADRDRLRIPELGGTIYKFNKSREPPIRYIPFD